MMAMSVPRFSRALVMLGYLFWIPAAGLLILAIINALLLGGRPDLSFVLIAVVTLPPIVVGLVVIQRKGVWRWQKCGYGMDRV